jgi:cell division GTPase FtsZ
MAKSTAILDELNRMNTEYLKRFVALEKRKSTVVNVSGGGSTITREEFDAIAELVHEIADR